MHALVILLAFFAGAYAKWQNWDWIVAARVKSAVAFVPSAPSRIRDHFQSVAAERRLPLVSLELKPEHLQKIRSQRQAALSDGFLRSTDTDYVPARLTHDGHIFPVRLRLKGDRTAHLVTDKWSMRIKAKGDSRPFGMRSFSLQHPMTRFYLNEWGFLENLRREGIMAVRYEFVRLVLNGEDKGIYALEEHFSRELLEANRRREGVIIAFEERPSYHVEASRRGWHWEDWDVAARLSAWQVQDLRAFDSRHIKRKPELSVQRDQALELLRAYQQGRRRASEVFDVALMGRYLALVDLWTAWHAVLWQNTRYYYNPVTARLEPVGFDAMPLWGDSDAALVPARLDDRSVNGPLRDPKIAAVYLSELERVCDPAYLNELQAAMETAFEDWQHALRREFRDEPRCRLGSDLKPPWPALARRQEYIREALHADKTILASATYEMAANSTASGGQGYLVTVRNISVLPVEVVGFRVSQGPLIPAASSWTKHRQVGVWENPDGSIGIAPSGLEELRFDESAASPLILPGFFVPVSTALGETGGGRRVKLEVATRLPGQADHRWVEVRIARERIEDSVLPPTPTVEEVLRSHPFLRQTEDGLAIPSGSWEVTGDLVLPQGEALRVDPGTTLRFDPGAILYTGSALDLHGEEDRPIWLEPKQRSWGGVVVLNAATESSWRHVVVSGTAGIKRGGWMPSGGVTFYKSGAVLADTMFVGCTSEDALNIIHAHCSLSDCGFSRCASDAFDGDFVTGTIEGCTFEDIGGDAVDVSGSTISVNRVEARRIGDKAVSVGEGSSVDVTDLTAVNVGMAVASKDLSSVSVTGATIRGAHVGLGCYTKKPSFGAARIKAEQVEFRDTDQRVLVQTGSSVSLDGADQPASDFDVDALYAQAWAQ